MLFKEKPIIVANWKMNPINSKEAKELLDLYIKTINFNNINLVVAPPVIYLELLKTLLISSKVNNIYLSSQNICSEYVGAFTGEISVGMVKDVGCKYTIIGHSERRQYYQETNELIAKKCLTALNSKLIPIVCVGETKQQLEQGEMEVKSILNKQLKFILDDYANQSVDKNLEFLIAYEPVWAIGSGLSADASYINNICGYIREAITNATDSKINVKILYGGSVNKDNFKSIFALPNINGALIGGGSLIPSEFATICNNC